MRKKPIDILKARSEYEDQCAIFEWAALNEYRFPELKLLFGSLMGVRLPYKLLNKHKKAGMKKGKPDIHLPVARGGYIGLWIELKSLTGKKPDDTQMEMLRLLNYYDHATYWRKGSDAAIKLIKDYLQGKIKKEKI